jgi:lactate permease
VTSNFLSVPLADVVASVISAGAVVLLLRVWRPSVTYTEGGGPAPAIAGGAADVPSPDFARRVEHPDARWDVVRAYGPYLIVIVVFVLGQIGPIKTLIGHATYTFAWPGLHAVNAKGAKLGSITFTLNLLTTPGTQMLIAGLLTMVALLSPILGWIGTAVTGSDTSSNSLFGALQVTAATKAGLSQTLMAAANSSGGVLGKMISPQNLAIAAAAVGLDGREGDIFRRVFGWTVLFLAGMCVLVLLQSTTVLSWMVP